MVELRSFHLSVEDNQLLTEHCVFYNQISLTAVEICKCARNEQCRGRLCPYFQGLFHQTVEGLPINKDVFNHILPDVEDV